MQISVTFRKTDSSDALKEYAVKKVGKLQKYLNSSFEADVILEAHKNHHLASVNISSNTGINIQGEEQSDNMYASIDLVIAKLERQIKKHRQKLREFSNTTPSKMAKLNVYAPESFYEDSQADEELDEHASLTPTIIKTENVAAEYLTVEEAVMKLEFQKQDFLVFTNKASNQISILHLRKDGNYALIEV
ncbi:ribosome-associated translation inhibitor RaiA [bacterium]|nr:ribosome-associated translation inhibitor RaiA [bacterium]